MNNDSFFNRIIDIIEDDDDVRMAFDFVNGLYEKYGRPLTDDELNEEMLNS